LSFLLDGDGLETGEIVGAVIGSVTVVLVALTGGGITIYCKCKGM